MDSIKLFQEGIKEYKRGNLKKSMDLFRGSISLDDKNPKVWNALGVTLSKVDNNEDAKKCFENALLYEPENITYQKNLLRLNSRTSTQIIKKTGIDKKTRSIIYGDFYTRMCAHIIDTILIIITSIGCLIILGVTLYFVFGVTRDSSASWEKNAFYSTIILITLIYYTLFESSKDQATPGKKYMNLMVVNNENSELTKLRSLKRNFLRVIPFVNIVAYLMIEFSDKKQGLHDRVAKTFVIFKE